jgi:hypothetical protein
MYRYALPALTVAWATPDDAATAYRADSCDPFLDRPHFSSPNGSMGESSIAEAAWADSCGSMLARITSLF